MMSTSVMPLFCIPKILKNESNSQHQLLRWLLLVGCFVSQRYWKMKAIHNSWSSARKALPVVLYPKDTEKWKQFTTPNVKFVALEELFCIPKILKNESNSQQFRNKILNYQSCFVSQRYWKMKAIHNKTYKTLLLNSVVLYPKDTEKWKQFTTVYIRMMKSATLFCIPKILKNESNSQQPIDLEVQQGSCFVSQRYWKMKAIHNSIIITHFAYKVVLYPKDTEKWKQFTTMNVSKKLNEELFCIPKILKNESNSQR